MEAELGKSRPVGAAVQVRAGDVRMSVQRRRRWRHSNGGEGQVSVQSRRGQVSRERVRMQGVYLLLCPQVLEEKEESEEEGPGEVKTSC